jgi:hypothetical protein
MIIIVNLRLFQDCAALRYNLGGIGPYILYIFLPVMLSHDTRMKPVYEYPYQVPGSVL